MGDFSIPHGTFPPGYAATFGASGASPTAMNIHTAEFGLLRSQMTRIEALLQMNLVRATIAATLTSTEVRSSSPISGSVSWR